MVPLGPQNHGSAMRPPPPPPLDALGGPEMPGMMSPGGGTFWPNPTNANSISYSSASLGNYVGPQGGRRLLVTPIMSSSADSINSGDMYTLMNAVPSGPNRPNFLMGSGFDGPMCGLGRMESHNLNGSLGSGDMDSLFKNSPNDIFKEKTCRVLITFNFNT